MVKKKIDPSKLGKVKDLLDLNSEVRVSLVKDPALVLICKRYMQRGLDEEATYERHHNCIDPKELEKDLCSRELIHFIGAIDFVPIGYAALEICDCGILEWRSLYVPKKLRKHGIALRFARGVIRQLGESFGPEQKVQVTYSVNNRAMASIFRYFRFKPTYRTGVSKIGEILNRRGNRLPGKRRHSLGQEL